MKLEVLYFAVTNLHKEKCEDTKLLQTSENEQYLHKFSTFMKNHFPVPCVTKSNVHVNESSKAVSHTFTVYTIIIGCMIVRVIHETEPNTTKITQGEWPNKKSWTLTATVARKNMVYNESKDDTDKFWENGTVAQTVHTT